MGKIPACRKILQAITITVSCYFAVPPAFACETIDKSSQGYTIVLPNVKKRSNPCPVLLCLPGSGIKVKQDINQWAFASCKAGFIAIGIDIDYPSIQSPQDMQALYQRIQALITEVSRDYAINVKGVYIAGTSAGGMMSLALALQYPNAYKAVGVISGGRMGFGADANLQKAKGQYFYFAHGKKDKSISISEFYATKSKLEKRGGIIEFKILPEGEHTLPTSYYKEAVEWFSKLEANQK